MCLFVLSKSTSLLYKLEITSQSVFTLLSLALLGIINNSMLKSKQIQKYTKQKYYKAENSQNIASFIEKSDRLNSTRIPFEDYDQVCTLTTLDEEKVEDQCQVQLLNEMSIFEKGKSSMMWLNNEDNTEGKQNNSISTLTEIEIEVSDIHLISSNNKLNIKKQFIRKQYKKKQIKKNKLLQPIMNQSILLENSPVESDFQSNNQIILDDFESSLEHQLQKSQSLQQNPTAISSYYMNNLKDHIQGQIEDPFMAQMYLNHFIQTFDILQKVKQLKQPQMICWQNKVKPQKKQQKTLVIDLDETLIHCNEFSTLKSDFTVQVPQEDGSIFQAAISIRPYAQTFLQNMAKYYEIMIFTASNEDYANKIIDILDPERNLVQYRLFRNDCITLPNGYHVKDLRMLNRNLKDILLVDNSAYSYAYQLDNGIPILPYLDNKNDQELIHLENYLKNIISVDDVRKENEKLFKFKIMQSCLSIQHAVQNIL